MKKASLLAGIMVLCFVVGGCGTGKTVVMQPPATKIEARSINLVLDDPAVSVPEEISQKLKGNLEKELFESKEERASLFMKGSDVTLRCRIIQYDTGDRFNRWFWGGIGNAGEGTITVQARFVDQAGQEITSIQSEGKIGSGFFGGSFDSAIEKCSEEIAQYAADNFR